MCIVVSAPNENQGTLSGRTVVHAINERVSRTHMHELTGCGMTTSPLLSLSEIRPHTRTGFMERALFVRDTKL
ncbi:MAG: hypothetical protein OXN89_27165 [Bryobacterales bacterium]|nr:hypothetical protein [Bryobacterales bacterium]